MENSREFSFFRIMKLLNHGNLILTVIETGNSREDKKKHNIALLKQIREKFKERHPAHYYEPLTPISVKFCQ